MSAHTLPGHRLVFLAQADGTTATTLALVGVTASVIVLAGLGAVYVSRLQARRLREESGHADGVFGRLGLDDGTPGGFDGGAVRLGARRRLLSLDAELTEAEGTAALPLITRQEAEIYLEHHRIALRHHAAYQQASLWAGMLGFSVLLVGAALSYFVGLDVGVVTAVAGAVPAAAGGLLFQQAGLVGDRTAENLRGLEGSVRRFGALQAALATTAEINDRATRDRMYEAITMHMLSPPDEQGTTSLPGRRNQPDGAGGSLPNQPDGAGDSLPNQPDGAGDSPANQE